MKFAVGDVCTVELPEGDYSAHTCKHWNGSEFIIQSISGQCYYGRNTQPNGFIMQDACWHEDALRPSFSPELTKMEDWS